MGSPLEYPVVALGHGDPTALGLQRFALSHVPVGHGWGRCQSGPVQSPASGPWEVSELICLPALLGSCHQGELSGTSLASSPATPLAPVL